MSTLTPARPDSARTTQTRAGAGAGTLRRIVRWLALLVAGLAALLLLLPVLASPFLTGTPLAVNLLLLAADAGLIYFLLAHARTPAAVMAGIGAMALVAALAVVASQRFARTPAYTAADGWPLPDSIAVMEQIDLNGSEQWVTIRGQDVDNPVLLFLAGGPGGSELTWTRSYLPQLEEHFVVVNWDQPGAGKSYGALDPADMTVERYVDDALELTDHLRARFHQEKIYLVGESWGTILGIKLIQAHPELYHAYVGSGQMVNTVENDRLGYELALEYAEAQGNVDTAETLRRNGPPPYFDGNPFMQYARYLMVLNGHMAANAPGDGRAYNQLTEVIVGPEYGFVDKVNWFRGLNDTFNAVYPQLTDLDFISQAPQLETPVYFTIGRHDVNAMAPLVERYYAVLDAPHKELIWFERSGHTPLWEERDKFVDVLVNRVLDDTQPAVSQTRSADLADGAAVAAFFDEFIPHQLRTDHIAGAAVAVIHDGEVRFAKGYGYADLADRRPVAADRTLLRTDSTGKLFVWTAVMQQVQAGQLDLDADVNRYLDFEIPPAFDQPITLRHLLSHSAGFADQGYLFAHSEERVEPSGAFLASHIPARVRPPGEVSAYSNYGTALAAYIVTRTTGMPFDEYVETRIFAPLGMEQSTFRQPLPVDLAGHASTNYRYTGDELEPLPFQYLRIPSAGEGHMTVTDMAKFMQAHLAQGDTPILGAETLEEMHSRLYAHRPEVNGFAYGFAESTINGERVLRHEGNNPGMSSSTLFLIPEQEAGVYVAYNSNGGFGPGEEVRSAFFNHFYPTVSTPTTVARLTAEQTDAITGAYRPTRRFYESFAKMMPLFAPAYGDVTIGPESDGTFNVQGLAATRLTYAPVAPDHLRLLSGAQDSWGDLWFETNDAGQISTLFVENQPYKAFDKLGWSQRADLHRIIGIVAWLVIASALAVAAVVWLLRRRWPLPAWIDVDPMAWGLLLGGSLLMVLFPAALLATIEEAYLYGVTAVFVMALALPLLAVGLAGASAVAAVTGRGRDRWGNVGAAYYGIILAAMMVLAWWLNYWNLLGWRF